MVDTSAPNSVWVVDDDEGMCNAIQDLLQPQYCVQYFTEIDKIESALKDDCPGVLILDLKFGMNESAGLEFLERIRKWHKFLPVIVCSVIDDIEAALVAGRNGVIYYIQKKVDGSFSINLLQTVDNVFNKTVPDVLIAQIIDDSDFFFRITRRTLDSCDHVVQYAMRCFLREISTIGPSVTKLTERTGYSAEA